MMDPPLPPSPTDKQKTMGPPKVSFDFSSPNDPSSPSAGAPGEQGPDGYRLVRAGTLDSVDSMDCLAHSPPPNAADNVTVVPPPSTTGDNGDVANTSFAVVQAYLSRIALHMETIMETPDLSATGSQYGFPEGHHHRPSRKTSVADVSDSFRLYFGSNIVTFPFVISLAGSMGSLLGCIPVAIMLHLGLCVQLRAKQVVLEHVLQDHTRHTELREYSDLVRYLWTYPLASSHPATSATVEMSNNKNEQNNHNKAVSAVTGPRHPGETPVEVRSRIPKIVHSVIGMSQFLSCCSFSALVSKNVEGLFHLSSMASMVSGCIILAVLHVLYRGDSVRKTFAFLNNGCLLAATLIIVAVTMDPAATNQDPAAVEQLMPATIAGFLTLLPVVCDRISPALYVLDVESTLAARVISRTRKRDLKKRRASKVQLLQQQQGAASAVDDASHAARRPSDVADGDDDLPPDHHASADRTAFILKRFERFCVRASAGSLLILVAFGELIYHRFKDKTNAVIATSLPESTLKTVLLFLMWIGLSCAAAINVAAIGGVLDGLRLAERPIFANSFVVKALAPVANIQRVEFYIIRLVVFVGAFIVLVTIPFYDLLAALGGSLGWANFSFIVPAVVQVQAQKRVLEAAAAAAGESSEIVSVTFLDAFWALSFLRKVEVLALALFGIFILLSGTSNALISAVERAR